MSYKTISCNQDLFQAYPDSRCVYHWNGGTAYFAKKGRKYILWIDEREVLDFLEFGNEDVWMGNGLVTLYLFDSKSEREQYTQEIRNSTTKAKQSNRVLKFLKGLFFK
jgi:hypothetical protein